MDFGKILVKGTSAILLLSSFVSLAASADELNQTGINFKATKHISSSLPGVPAYFDETINAPSKMMIAKTTKSGQPDFDNMSEATPVRIGCGIVVIDDLISNATGAGTAIVGSLWAAVLAFACCRSWIAGKSIPKMKLALAFGIAAAAWYAPLVLLITMVLRFVYLTIKFAVKGIFAFAKYLSQWAEKYDDDWIDSVKSRESDASSNQTKTDSKQSGSKESGSEQDNFSDENFQDNSTYLAVLERCLNESNAAKANSQTKEEKELCQLK